MDKHPLDPLKGRLSNQLDRLARKRVLVGFLLAALSIGGRIALLPWIPIPKPAIQDEFSYLLAAETYAAGRLTNPQHPMWMHFETVHEIMRPTYQSKYQPLQGLLLALGQVCSGVPWAGVLIGMGALNAAIWWALTGWLPPRWALLGSLLALLRVGFLNYWSESYWGGAAAAAAGALVIGAVPRLRASPATKPKLILAVGLALLAASRPYEGLLVAVICLGAILIKVPVKTIILPMAIVLIPAFTWMGFYNYRVTGNALVLPYQSHVQQYETWSTFVWQTHPRPAPRYNHEDLRATWVGWEQKNRGFERGHPFRVKLSNSLTLIAFYLGLPLMICLIVFLVPMWRHQPKLRLAIALSAAYAAGLATETLLWPHYVSPGTAFVFILAAAALRRLRHLSGVTMASVVALIILLDLAKLRTDTNRFLFDKRDFLAERNSVLRTLEQAPGKQLVLVEYGPEHDVNHQWVYNKADIDKAQIVWARAMDPQKDLELLDYYHDRAVWRLIDYGKGRVELLPRDGRK